MAHPGGRPSKINTINQDTVALLCRKGFTDAEIAQVLDVTEQTFNNWKQKNAKFFESLKDWKLTADAEVERSLYQRACGGTWGEKFYPPDPVSMIFWLKNRQPERWREKHEVNLDLSDLSKAIIEAQKRLKDKGSNG